MDYYKKYLKYKEKYLKLKKQIGGALVFTDVDDIQCSVTDFFGDFQLTLIYGTHRIGAEYLFNRRSYVIQLGEEYNPININTVINEDMYVYIRIKSLKQCISFMDDKINRNSRLNDNPVVSYALSRLKAIVPRLDDKITEIEASGKLENGLILRNVPEYDRL